MASASALGDGAGEERARPSAISIRIVPCAGREEAWGVHRILGGSSQLPEVSSQIAVRRVLPTEKPMHADADHELFRCYADHGSDEAFTELWGDEASPRGAGQPP
jgi:hypothetical protein